MTKSGYAGCWENIKENIMDKYNFKVTSGMVRKLSETHKFIYDKTNTMVLVPKTEEEKNDKSLLFDFNDICDFLDKKVSICSARSMRTIYKYFDKKNKESKPVIVDTHNTITTGMKYTNKPKELPEGQNVIITPYEDKKNSEVKPQEADKVLMYVPEYVNEKDGKTINLDKEMKDKIMEIAKSGILSILHLKSEEAYVELIKEKIEREILKLTEFHSTGTFAFTFENDEIQLVFVGNHIGIHLKEAA